nr:hypothetical protein Iba_chr08aCG6550 [Ipomoea batatas]GMD26714.1 hypothetical protein Iba_chr08dCG6900 [Ipomoea batatas]
MNIKVVGIFFALVLVGTAVEGAYLPPNNCCRPPVQACCPPAVAARYKAAHAAAVVAGKRLPPHPSVNKPRKIPHSEPSINLLP